MQNYVIVYGGRQTGKSSLLARLYQQARDTQQPAVFIDFDAAPLPREPIAAMKYARACGTLVHSSSVAVAPSLCASSIAGMMSATVSVTTWSLNDALAPRVAQIIMNTTFRMFPDSSAAKKKEAGLLPEIPSADQVAFQQFMRGIYF